MSPVSRATTPTQGLRTRYFPKSRIGHGFVSAVPWLNALVLIFFFYWLHDKMVQQPGTQLRLTPAPLTSATRSDMTAVLQRTEAVGLSGSPLLYFDDHVFNIAQADQMNAFRVALQKATNSSRNKSLVLYVDAGFTFDIVNSLINVARDAGVTDVNLASQPLAASRTTTP